MITVDDEKIYTLYNEGRLGDLAKVGAFAGASLMGNPTTTMGDTTYNQEYSSENMNVLDADTFLDLWIKYYQTDGRVKGKEADAVKKVREGGIKLSDGINIPGNAVNSINNAVYIFGGDEGVSPNVLTDLLTYTGEVESLYKTRIQNKDPETGKHGPARGYWQVEPFTAIDLLTNSRNYFGGKFMKFFNKEFKQKYGVKNACEDFLFKLENTKDHRDILAKYIYNSDNLAAAFAAAKWISVSKTAGLNHIRNK